MSERRCLVIDDDPIAATFLVELLRARGLEVDRAHNLSQAHQRLLASTYDFLLADRRLPDGDGVDWMRRRKGAPDWPASMRCLVISGDALTADQLPDGVAQLRKPLDAGLLLQWLAVDGEAAPGAAADAQANPPGAELPLLDDAAALQKFGGRREALVALRGMLRDELIAGASWQAQLDQRPPSASVLDSLHRLRAACALTGCPRLGELSSALETRLRSEAGADAHVLRAFLRCVVDTLDRL